MHDNENGCGALTGWSWSDTNSGGQAYFNLPFFIKSGCVERAIASAGGPKVSCSGQGLGKRSTDKRTLETRTDLAKPVSNPPNFDDARISNAYNPPDVDVNLVNHVYNAPNWDNERRSTSVKTLDTRVDHAKPVSKPPNFDDARIKDAYNPPNVDINLVEHVYNAPNWDHESRSLIQLSQLHERSKLSKRGCASSKAANDSPPGSPPQSPVQEYFCNPVIPGVDECNAKVAEHGNVGKKTSLFYTGWGANGAPGAGGIMARKYAAKHMCNMDTVSWSGLCNGEWKINTQKAIIEPFKKSDMSSDELFALDDKADPFLKHLAQAFAETSKGDVYVFIPQGQLPNNAWNKDSAWGGWEYPALTDNQKVTRILRVDLDVSDPSNPTGTPEVIWDRSKGDGKADYDPKGVRGPSLADGLPQDQIPQGWQDPGSL